LMPSMVKKHVPLRSIFWRRFVRKSFGARSRDYGNLVMAGMLFFTWNCCTTRDVWLGVLSWWRNHCPCLPLVAPLPPSCIEQTLQNLHA
jgi:hypothetical protein